jgi:hypothetical protein
MANTLKFGNGEWYGKKDTILAYNDENNNYKPLPFNFERASSATVVNKDGLIETVGSDMPRIDYKDNSKGALLLEPQRSNLLPYSGNFSTWAEVFAEGTISDIISPNGTDYGIKITDNNVNNTHRIQLGVTTASSGSFTYSLFLKKGTLTTAYFQVFSGTTASNANVDLENGTITSGGLGINHTIEDYGNDWYRCSISGTLASTSTTVYLYTKQSGSYVGNGDYLYAWGAQLEQGSYATSYIPTQGGAVTRLADSCNNGGNEQVINSTEGVLYAEISALANDLTTRIISLSDNTTSNRILIKYDNIVNRLEFFVIVAGIAQYSFIAIVDDLLTYNKIALKYKTNDFQVYFNGIELDSSVSGNTISANTLTTLKFQASNGTSDFYGNVKDVRLYNTALTDQELQALTS